MRAFGFTHVVKEGESLSVIAQALVSPPVYGEKGSLEKVLALNPWIKDPNHILPNQEIDFGDLVKEKDVSTAASNEIKENTRKPLSEGFQRGDGLVLSPYFSNTTLSVRDTASGSTSTLNSAANFGIDAYYLQQWDEDFSTFLHFKLGSISFEPPATSTRTLTNGSKVMSGFGAGANYTCSSKLMVGFLVDYEKALFARAVSTTEKTVDAVMIPQVGGRVSYDFIKFSPFTLGASGSLDLLLPGSTDSYQIRLGAQTGAILYLKRNAISGEQMNYQVGIGASSRSQNTSITSQSQTDLTLLVQVYFGKS